MNTNTHAERQEWEIVGYLAPVIKAPVLVKPVLRKSSDPEKYFFANDPGIDVRSAVEEMPQKDDKGFPLLGAPSFVRLPEPVAYQPHSACVYMGHQELVQVWVSDNVAAFIEQNFL